MSLEATDQYRFRAKSKRLLQAGSLFGVYTKYNI
jgi:hypothetical protein